MRELKSSPLVAETVQQAETTRVASGHGATFPATGLKRTRTASLKLRIVTIVMGVLSVAVIIGVVVIIHNAREAVRSELASSFNFARRVLTADAMTVRAITPGAELRQVLAALQHVRHLRVVVKHADGVSSVSDGLDVAPTRHAVPRWFLDLVAPTEQFVLRMPIVGPGTFRELVVEADPGDEVLEVWHDVKPVGAVLLVAALTTLILVYLGLSLGLRPLDRLLEGFERLEAGRFDVVLPEDGAAEVARVNRQFNRLVAELHRAAADNQRLARHLVSMQEDERRDVARELHDEFAPPLFGMRVALTTARSQLEASQAGMVEQQLDAVEAMVEQVQQHVRALLTRLRPLVLDELSLHDAVRALVDDWRRREPATTWTLVFDDVPEALSDTVAVTVYRVVQECLTNAARHASAALVSVRIQGLDGVGARPIRAPEGLRILVEDDGRGIASNVSHGFGLLGMQERVRALGGTLALRQPAGGGLRVEAVIMLEVAD